MIVYKFKARLLVDDRRTGLSAGTLFYPKGIYYQKKNIILVGDVLSGNTIRLAFPITSIDVTVIRHEED